MKAGRIFLGLALVAAAGVAAALFWFNNWGPQEPSLALVVPEPGQVVKTLSLRGRSQPAVSAKVVARLETLIEDLPVTLGRSVEVDEVLAKIRLTPGFLLQVQEAVANYQRALIAREQQVSAVVDCPARGRISRILIQPGDRVEASQPLAKITVEPGYLERMDNLALELSRLEQAVASKSREVAGYRDLAAKKLLPRETLSAAEAEVARLKKALDMRHSQKQRLDRSLKLLGPAGSREAVILSPQAGRVLRILKEEGQLVAPGEHGALLYLARGTGNKNQHNEDDFRRLEESLSQLRLAESRLEALSAHTGRSYLNDQSNLESGFIRSPVAGEVTWINLRLTKGYTCHQGEPLFVIEDLSRLLVVCRVHEIDFPKIKPGQRVEIFFDAFPRQPFEAVLVGQPKAAQTDFNAPYSQYEVVFALSNPDSRLVGGQSAEVIINIEQKESPLTLPNSCLLSADGSDSVLVARGEGLKRRAVKVGLVGDERVEILSGLEPGEEVVRFPHQTGAH